MLSSQLPEISKSLFERLSNPEPLILLGELRVLGSKVISTVSPVEWLVASIVPERSILTYPITMFETFKLGLGIEINSFLNLIKYRPSCLRLREPVPLPNLKDYFVSECPYPSKPNPAK